MKKYIFILFFIVCQQGFSQLHIFPQAVTAYNLSPSERYTYLFNHTDNFGENSRIRGGNGSWTVFAARFCWPDTPTSPGGCRLYKDIYQTFYKDTDGDGYGDVNDFIVLRVETKFSSNSTDIDDENVSNINLIEYSGQATDIYGNDDYPYGVKILSCTYNGYTWVRNTLGVDCDDNDSTVPSSNMSVYFFDYDRDGYGGARFSSNGAPISYRVAPIDCTPLPGHSRDYVLNNEDCYDWNALVTTNPINWYLDEDGDGYGNSSIYINSCKPPSIGTYSALDGDCDDQNAEYNIEQITWYADFDNDGFGDENDTVVSPCPVENYIKDCYFDSCPTEAGTRENGCPLVAYDFDNTNQNYNYERTYLQEYTPETLANANNTDVIESISYKDDIGRIKQEVNIGTTPLGKDIYQHFEYDGNGQSTKLYMPYSSNSTSGVYDANALANTLNYYNTPAFENTANPYSNVITEASPLNRVLEESAPGNDWAVDEASDYDHTIKYDYNTNNSSDQIKKFRVLHEADFIENTVLHFERYYTTDELIKATVKNENWQPNQIFENDNTSVTYTDKFGNTVLNRTYNENIAHDTYYVYDDLGNLTYVLPPEAADQILEQDIAGRVASQVNYSWISLVNVDKNFAEDYNKKLSDYNNADILNADIDNAYGGQGGFTVTTLENSQQVLLSINFSATEALELKKGELVSLKDYGNHSDTELGRITGEGYNYTFFIKSNAIHIDGEGKLNGINQVFDSNTKLTYEQTFLWTRYR